MSEQTSARWLTPPISNSSLRHCIAAPFTSVWPGVSRKLNLSSVSALRQGGRMAEVVREFVGLASPVIGRAGAGGHPCQGIYHRAAGTRPKTALIATHYNVDFSEHYLASFMA